MNANQRMRLVQMLLRGRHGQSKKIAVVVVGLLLGYSYLQPIVEKRFGISLPTVGNHRAGQQETRAESLPFPQTSAQPHVAGEVSAGERRVLEAFRQRTSDLIVQVDVVVKKNLPDDNVGSRHQKMILSLPSGHTLLLAHNIDLAQRVPAREGDSLRVKGEYEYSEQGGVLHWTHHDPGGRHPGGWIEHNGQRYE